jgi:hypothetical protein
MRIAVATHGHCVDGLVSAALFSFLARRVENPGADFTYHACAYGPNQTAPSPRILDGDQNAILDFGYWADPSVTWYFDHHPTAFVSEDDRRVFEARRPEGRHHYDPRASSAAHLIARVAREHFELDVSALEPLVAFADRVDTAQFESAKAALDRSTPEGRLIAVVERFGDSDWLERHVRSLLDRSLTDFASLPTVEDSFAQLAEEHHSFVEHVRARALVHGPVVMADLTDRIHPTLGKFVTYALYPQSTYSVILGRIPGSIKIAVGYNPWSGSARRHDIGSLCQERGGGGHPVVGGLAFPPQNATQARDTALELTTLLGTA